MDALNHLLLSPTFSDSMPSEDEDEVEHLTELCLAHGPKPAVNDNELDAQDHENEQASACMLYVPVGQPYTLEDTDTDAYDTDVDSIAGDGNNADDSEESLSEAEDDSDTELDDDMVTSPLESVAYNSAPSGRTDGFFTVTSKRRRDDDVHDDDSHRSAKRPRLSTPPAVGNTDFGELMKLLADAKGLQIAAGSAVNDIPRTPEGQIIRTGFKSARHG